MVSLWSDGIVLAAASRALFLEACSPFSRWIYSIQARQHSLVVHYHHCPSSSIRLSYDRFFQQSSFPCLSHGFAGSFRHCVRAALASKQTRRLMILWPWNIRWNGYAEKNKRDSLPATRVEYQTQNFPQD